MLSQTWMTVPGGTSEGCEKYVPIAVRAATNAADGWNWVALSNWYQNSLARRSPSIPGTGGNSGPGRLAASAGRVPALATAPRPAIPATASDAWRKCRRSGCLDIETPFLSRSCPRSRVIRGESGPPRAGSREGAQAAGGITLDGAGDKRCGLTSRIAPLDQGSRRGQGHDHVCDHYRERGQGWQERSVAGVRVATGRA